MVGDYYVTNCNGKVPEENAINSLQLLNSLMGTLYDIQDHGLLVEASISVRWKQMKCDKANIISDNQTNQIYIVNDTSIKDAGKMLNENPKDEN
jgi:hypothetical protein